MKNIKVSIKKVYIIIIVLSLLVSLLTIIYLRLTNNEGIILDEDLTCNFREEVYIKDFIAYIDGKLISNYRVDTNEVGFKNLNVTFKNKYGFIVSKKITIEIKDVTAPTIVVSDPYTVVSGNIENLEEAIFCADDYDDLISCTINGEYNLDVVGKYNLEMVAVDNSGNKSEKEFTLNVIEKMYSNNKLNTNSTYTGFSKIYNQYKNEFTDVGLDISKWQGNVDYAKLKSQGVDFVMLKIGGQTKIGGDFNVDPMFYDNIKGAIDNDIRVGVYFYSYAKSEEEAIRQANWIMDILEEYEIDMPIVFDWENWNSYTKFHISFHTLNKIAKAFIGRVEELGYEGVLYSSKYYLDNIWYKEDYTNWIAYYTNNFNDYRDYYMWQLCSDGKIDGIDGYVDIDVMYKK